MELRRTTLGEARSALAGPLSQRAGRGPSFSTRSRSMPSSPLNELYSTSYSSGELPQFTHSKICKGACSGRVPTATGCRGNLWVIGSLGTTRYGSLGASVLPSRSSHICLPWPIFSSIGSVCLPSNSRDDGTYAMRNVHDPPGSREACLGDISKHFNSSIILLTMTTSGLGSPRPPTARARCPVRSVGVH